MSEKPAGLSSGVKKRPVLTGGLRALALRGAFAALLLSACDTGEAKDFSSDAGANTTEVGAVVDNSDTGEVGWPKPGDEGDESRGAVLMEEYPDAEPSGIVFVEASATFYVVSDDGRLFQLDEEGNVLGHWEIGGDPESLALDPDTNTLFVGFEGGSSVRSWDVATNSFIEGDSCSLDLAVSGKKGFEAMAFVPEKDAPRAWAESLPEGSVSGYIVAGTQASATLSVYPIDLCAGGARLRALDLGSAELVSSKDDVSGLTFDLRTKLLFALHDEGNVLDVMDLSGNLHVRYRLPDGKLEGLSLRQVDCERGEATVVAADDGGRVFELEGLPIECE